MADENKTPTPTPAPKAKEEKAAPAAKADIPGYNKDEAEEIQVETTGEFQLYDPVTQTLYVADGKTKGRENDQFIQTNIKRGKLKKVK